MLQRGLIHFYYGDGKGKTTAALGLAMRAVGCGWRVVIVQLLKGRGSGELSSLETLGVTVYRGKGCDRFVSQMSTGEKEEAKRAATENLMAAWRLAREGGCDLLILDEAATAYQLNMLEPSLLEEVVRQKPEKTELVITGHGAVDFLLKAADYVTEMKKVHHPYDRGIGAREGIEY